MMDNLKYLYVKPVVYPRNDKTYDATVSVEVVDYTSDVKPEVLHKYVKLGFHSVKDAELFAYNEAIRVQDVMLSAMREYLKKYKDAQ